MSSSRKRVEPLVSIISTKEKGLSTDEKKATFCSTPSSQSRKSSFCRFGMYLPSRSMTLTGNVTRVVFTLITSPASTSSGPLLAGSPLGREPVVPVDPPNTGGREGVVDPGGVEPAVGGFESCPARRGRDWPCRIAEQTVKSARSNKLEENVLIRRLLIIIASS